MFFGCCGTRCAQTASHLIQKTSTILLIFLWRTNEQPYDFRHISYNLCKDIKINLLQIFYHPKCPPCRQCVRGMCHSHYLDSPCANENIKKKLEPHRVLTEVAPTGIEPVFETRQCVRGMCPGHYLVNPVQIREHKKN